MSSLITTAYCVSESGVKAFPCRVTDFGKKVSIELEGLESCYYKLPHTNVFLDRREALEAYLKLIREGLVRMEQHRASYIKERTKILEELKGLPRPVPDLGGPYVH